MDRLRTIFPVLTLLLLANAAGVNLANADELAAAETAPVWTQKPVVQTALTADGKVAAEAPATQAPADPPQKPASAALLAGPQANWIWGPTMAGDDVWYLKKTFTSKLTKGQLIATCDNTMTVFLNGRKVLASNEWQQPQMADVSRHLKSGENVLLVKAGNQGGVAGFALKLALSPEGKAKREFVISDGSWQAARASTDETWANVKTIGKMGVQPWRDVFNKELTGENTTTPAHFVVLPGFQVESLFKVPKNELGSWVCIAFDHKGRLLASDQGNKGIYRITPPALQDNQATNIDETSLPTRVEKLDIAMTSAQGMLHAFGYLYFSANGGPGSGLYRAKYLEETDSYAPVEKLRSFSGGGEHGPHALRLSPDGKSIYVIAGNHTNPPFKAGEDLNNDALTSRLASNWDEDLLLPRQWDARGHAKGKLAPGGWIAITDPEGKTWEMFSSGYRNPYDMAFNRHGELFAYDADMEWDMGSPWYRPTRVVHATSGSEFGWRSGTGKWPDYYVDSLPSLVDIGPGSPVGVEFGYGTKFPQKYQDALFICDWTFGTMYAIHLKDSGSSYSATKEEFLSRTPLPLTDVAVGPDGALYFTIGGRGTQSELFRVTYVGKESTMPATPVVELPGSQLRKHIEELHGAGKLSAAQQAELIDYLDSEDQHIRYAARVALDRHHPLSPNAKPKGKDSTIQYALSLARGALKPDADRFASATHMLMDLEFDKLSERQQLDYLRALAVVFIRLGEPDDTLRQQFLSVLDAKFPSKSERLNRELALMLVYLRSPTVITKTLALMQKDEPPKTADMEALLARNPGYGGKIASMLSNQPQLSKVYYALILRNMRYGWTLEQRKTYFEELARLRTKTGGASYQGFIDNIRKEALANASPSEQKILAGEASFQPPKLEELPKPNGPGKDWQAAMLTSLAADKLRNRDFEQGRKMFAAAQCVRCHRYDGEGGATGPDLSNVAGRFSVKDLIEATVEPSKVVSDQYQAVKILTEGGQSYSGRVISEVDGKITFLTDPVDATKTVEIARDDIAIMQPSTVSLMPKDLLNPLSEEEVLDLLAYLLSRGNPNDPRFKQK